MRQKGRPRGRFLKGDEIEIFMASDFLINMFLCSSSQYELVLYLKLF